MQTGASRTANSSPVRHSARLGTAAALAITLFIQQPLTAEARPRPSAPSTTQQQRTLSALNRFTFGPRPGDLNAIQAMGLDAWFEQQLNPSTLDDSALEARLAAYPAMQLPVADLEAKYPDPAALKRMSAGKLAVPSDPTRRAFVQDQIALYNAQQESKAGKKSGTAPAPPDRLPRDQIQRLLTLDPNTRFQSILALPPDDLVRLRHSLQGRELLAMRQGLSPEQAEEIEALDGSVRMISAEARDSRLLRDLCSERQLEAVMTDFWLNHFNVYDRKNQQEPYLLSTYERDTIRAHALGSFEDLLVATAESPAMLEYLDNARSIGPDSRAAVRQDTQRQDTRRPKKQAGLNENYGRELMELHTLGVNGGYTQADVAQVARVFTGWTIARPTQPNAGTFVFDDRLHEPGAKTVLGHTIPEGGINEGLAVLHLLATSPATARFLSTQLAIRFVSDTPPPALVDRMTASFLRSQGDIKTVLRTLWHSPEFWSAANDRAKVKTPEEFVLSAIRASGAEVIDPRGLVQSINTLGMPLYGMQTPQGYGWKQSDWVNTGALVSRMNFALSLGANHIPGVHCNLSDFLSQRPALLLLAVASSPEDQARAEEFRLEFTLLNGPVSERTRAAVLSQANQLVGKSAGIQPDLLGMEPATGIAVGRDPAPPAAAGAAIMAGLLLGSPEFQRR